MKKILTIISILIFSTSAYANDRLKDLTNGYLKMVIRICRKIENRNMQALDKDTNSWYYQ